MSASRCLTLGRLACNLARNTLLQNEKINVRKQIVRHEHHVTYYYRTYPKSPTPDKKYADFMSAVIWWWVFWHLFTDYHELLPHKFPDPSKWTDEELGIPPLDD